MNLKRSCIHTHIFASSFKVCTYITYPQLFIRLCKQEINFVIIIVKRVGGKSNKQVKSSRSKNHFMHNASQQVMHCIQFIRSHNAVQKVHAGYFIPGKLDMHGLLLCEWICVPLKSTPFLCSQIELAGRKRGIMHARVKEVVVGVFSDGDTLKWRICYFSLFLLLNISTFLCVACKS